jgi:hypothetical protein
MKKSNIKTEVEEAFNTPASSLVQDKLRESLVEDPMAVLAEVLLGSADGAIERQEARGQEKLCNAAISLLSTNVRCGHKGPNVDNPKKVLESWGIKVGEPKSGDEIFTECELPEGWKLKPSDHSMWNYLFDEHGRKRASMFYKAACYDRSTHIDLNSRFTIHRYYGEDDENFSMCQVFDNDKVVYESGRYAYPSTYDNREDLNKLDDSARRRIILHHEETQKQAWEECENWLEENWPLWRDEKEYW